MKGMNRREFAFKVLGSSLLASLPNTVYLSAQDNSDRRTVVFTVFARGGLDGLNVVVPVVDEVVNFMWQARPTIYGMAIPRRRPANGAWWFDNLIPIGNENSSDHPGVRLHPLYSRLFDISANQITCPTIRYQGRDVPLSRFLAFKAVFGVGPMDAVDLQTGSYRPDKSHDSMQAKVMAGNNNPGQLLGFSARFFDRVVHLSQLFDCIGMGGVSPRELGVTATSNRFVLTPNFNLALRSHNGYSFETSGCRDYQAANRMVGTRLFSDHMVRALAEYVENSDMLNPFNNRYLAMFTSMRRMQDISNKLNSVQIETQVNNQPLFDGQFIDFQGQLQNTNLYSSLGQSLAKFALYDGPELGNIRYALVSIGGNFDSHANQVTGASSVYPSHAAIAGMITGIMYNVVKAQLAGKPINVAIVVVSEFGRTVQENGSAGTDHGSASVAYAVANTTYHEGEKHRIIGPRVYVGQRGVEDWLDPTRVNLAFSPFDVPCKHGIHALIAAILRKYIARREDLIPEIIPFYKYMQPLNEETKYFADNLLNDI